MWKLSRKETAGARCDVDLRCYIPYNHHVTDNIVSLSDGSMLTVFRVRGRTTVCASEAELTDWYRDLNEMVKSLGSERIEVWTHWHHHIEHNSVQRDFANPFAAQLFERSIKRLEHCPAVFNDFYLSFLYKSDLGHRVGSFPSMRALSADELLTRQEREISHLDEITKLILIYLKTYGVEHLGVYYRDERGDVIPNAPVTPKEVDQAHASEPAPKPRQRSWVDAKGDAYSQILEFLSLVLNGNALPQPVMRGMIREYLPAKRLDIRTLNEGIVVQTEDSEICVRSIPVKLIEVEKKSDQIARLLSANFNFILCQNFSSLSSAAARGFLARQYRALRRRDARAQLTLPKIVETKNDLVARRITMGFYAGVLHCMSASMREAVEHEKDARLMLRQIGLEGLATIGPDTRELWFAGLPGNARLQRHRVAISSGEFVLRSSFQTIHTGCKTEGSAADALLAMASTVNGTTVPFFFDCRLRNHGRGDVRAGEGEAAIVIGSSPAQNMHFLTAMITSAARYASRLFVFDVGQSLKPLVEALGGSYHQLIPSIGNGWQPLQFEPNAENVSAAKRIIRAMLEGSLGGPLHFDDVAIVDKAVDAVMGANSSLVCSSRTLPLVAANLAIAEKHSEENHQNARLTSLLRPWCHGEKWGAVFDNSMDTCSLDEATIVGVDLSAYIEEDTAALLPAILQYVMHRARVSAREKAHSMFVFNNIEKYLSEGCLTQEIRRNLSGGAMKNTLYCFASNDANAVLRSPALRTLLTVPSAAACLSASSPDQHLYTRNLKITDAEYDSISCLNQLPNTYFVKQGNIVALAALEMDDAISDAPSASVTV